MNASLDARTAHRTNSKTSWLSIYTNPGPKQEPDPQESCRIIDYQTPRDTKAMIQRPESRLKVGKAVMLVNWPSAIACLQILGASPEGTLHSAVFLPSSQLFFRVDSVSEPVVLS